jgi:uncharacterized repeat protein (TIGR03803 family)
VEADDVTLYGTTPLGGQFNHGTVFKLHKDGSGYSVLHNFGSARVAGWPTEGGAPSSLLEGNDSILYGVAEAGMNGYGLVFKISKDGSGYHILYNFHSPDETAPNGLTEGSDGVLYGTARSSVFRINKDGSGYSSWVTPGGPRGGLIEGTNGDWYGVDGNIFKIKRDQSGYGVVYRFSESGGDGQWPAAPLLEGKDGALYGTTSRGGVEMVALFSPATRTEHVIASCTASIAIRMTGHSCAVIEASDNFCMARLFKEEQRWRR